MANQSISIAALTALRKAFCSIRTVTDLAELLAISPQKLVAIAARPRYFTFKVPKKTGKFRLIEDPDDRLQNVQDALNDYLQAVCWHLRTDAAYGFLPVPAADPSPRHIETNAEQHLGKKWLLNADLKDFFHKVTKKMITQVFCNPPFGFQSELTKLLTRLTTYRGRLPMGAPTSPALSNLAFIPVDEALLNMAIKRGWTYTRYADDMSFSSNQPITWKDYKPVRKITEKHGFPFNPEKVKLFGPEDAKIVTGLLLGINKIELPVTFIPQLAKDIRHLKGALAVQARISFRQNRNNQRFQRSIEGKLRFAGRIMGEHHPAVEKLRREYLKAIEPPSEYEVRSWLDFPYF